VDRFAVDANTLTSTARAIVDEFDGVKADVEPTIALAGVVSAASLSLGGSRAGLEDAETKIDRGYRRPLRPG